MILLLGLFALVGANTIPAEFTLDSQPIIAEHPLLSRGSPWPHALANVGLHAGVVLLWRVALQWTQCGKAAFITAALFGVHPVLSEVVPNLVG